jgi:8-oxo-dGTP diphosphatase
MCGRADVVAPHRFQSPALTVDAVWVAGGGILLVRRGRPPFRGRWALPGGFVEVGETVEQAVVRELWEETGLRPTGLQLLGVYSRPGRDPRGPTVSVAFRMRGKPRRPTGGSDAREARWIPLPQARSLAFDHDEIVADARRAHLGKGPRWRTPGRPAQK